MLKTFISRPSDAPTKRTYPRLAITPYGGVMLLLNETLGIVLICQGNSGAPVGQVCTTLRGESFPDWNGEVLVSNQ